MLTRFGKIPHVRTARLLAAAAVTLGILAPRPSFAQSSGWKGSVAPLYLWASAFSGDVTALSTTVPVSMSFGDAVDNLSGAFSLNVEAEKGRVGFFGDIMWVRLSSGSQFTIGTLIPRTVGGDLDLDNTFFEGGGSYLVSDAAKFAVIGGVRTYTVGTQVEFSGAIVDLTPIDTSRTAVTGFAGVTFRPEFNDKWRLLSRADYGGGTGTSWSTVLGVEFRPKPWAGLVLGYKALGIDISSDDKVLRDYDVTYYGPVFAFNLHWGAR